jgi:hypothetical protein
MMSEEEPKLKVLFTKKLQDSKMMDAIKNKVFGRVIMASGASGDFEKDCFGRPTQAFFKACQLAFIMHPDLKASGPKAEQIGENMRHLFQNTIFSELDLIQKDFLLELSNHCQIVKLKPK